MAEIREGMRVLPGWLQPFFDWLTGKRVARSPLRIRWTPVGRLTVSLAATLAGVALGVVAVEGPLPCRALLPVSWLVVTGGLRVMFVTHAHYAIHDALFRTAAANRAAGELLTALILMMTRDQFRESHLRHHSQKCATLEDDDVKALAAVGLHPGRSRAELWRALGRALVSPRFHAGFLGARLGNNFVRPPPWRRALAAAVQGAVLAAFWWVVSVEAWALVWLPPLLLFTQASALVNTVTEHAWFLPVDRDKDGVARLTWGRFLGDPVPAGGLVAWGRWWARLFFVHLPARLGVLVGDLSQHDVHHRHPRVDWANASWARQEDIDAGHPGWAAPYEDVWGSLPDHIDAVFTLWASLRPLTADDWATLRGAASPGA
jgi:fatty acid desaturase